MEINGVAHVFLTVSNFAACRPFYEKLLVFLGLTPVLQSDVMLYCVGGRTAVGIVPAEERYRDERFAQYRVGLHHVCFRARSREDVDACTPSCVEHGATIVHAPEDGRLGAGLLLGAVRGPRRHPSRGQPRARQGPPRGPDRAPDASRAQRSVEQLRGRSTWRERRYSPRPFACGSARVDAATPSPSSPTTTKLSARMFGSS